MPDFAEELVHLRQRSDEMHGRSPIVAGALNAIAQDAWVRGDELADGVLRLARDPALPSCCGALARMLWEDAITLLYVVSSPDFRIPQLRAGALEHHERLAKTTWGKEFGVKCLSEEDAEFLRVRKRRQRDAAKASSGRSGIRVDEFALLPPVSRRADEVGAGDQYAAYSIKSGGAVHFSFMALFEPEGGNEYRLKSSLATAAGSYGWILGTAADVLGMPDSAEILETLRQWNAENAPVSASSS